MKKFLSRPYRWAAIYSIILTGAFTFTMLDTFVLTKSIASTSTLSVSSKTSSTVSSGSTSISSSKETSTKQASQSQATVTDRSYQDENIKITIETVRKYNSNIYVADIQVSDPSYLKTALANNTYGRNITATTSDIAQEFKERGCNVAYNLDGGGSSTMYFNGEVINNPTSGKGISERKVSDIVYIGY